MKSHINFNRLFGSLSTLIALFSTAPIANATEYFPVAPSGTTIEGVNYGGSGCPQGSASVSIAADGSNFMAIFDQYIASIGPGTPSGDYRKFCQLDVNLHVPAGWSYTVFDAKYRGFTDLDRYVKATQTSTYFFTGAPGSSTLSTSWVGPITKDYEFTDELGLPALVWSPCGEDRNLQMKTSIFLRKLWGSTYKSAGLVTTDSIEGNVAFTWGWLWKKCS
ncbi:DUF4360 domain-containing protein [Methylolobus aquaticus]